MHEIFVFGSNLRGIHKKGAALYAYNNHGAIMGMGSGLQGSSYAIPTKFSPSKSLSLIEINCFVSAFLLSAKETTNYIYLLTPIGCGLAGYTPAQIAPLFNLAIHIPNIKIPKEFIPYLPDFANLHDRIATFESF